MKATFSFTDSQHMSNKSSYRSLPTQGFIVVASRIMTWNRKGTADRTQALAQNITSCLIMSTKTDMSK